MISQDFKIRSSGPIEKCAPRGQPPFPSSERKTLFHLKSERGRERAVLRQTNKTEELIKLISY